MQGLEELGALAKKLEPARQSTAKHAKHGYVVPRGYTQRAGKARVFRLMIYLYDPVWWVFCIFMFAGR